MQFLEDSHWLISWFLLIVGMVGIFRFVRGHLDKKPFTQLDRRYVMIFTSFFDLQATLGAIMYFGRALQVLVFRIICSSMPLQCSLPR